MATFRALFHVEPLRNGTLAKGTTTSRCHRTYTVPAGTWETYRIPQWMTPWRAFLPLSHSEQRVHDPLVFPRLSLRPSPGPRALLVAPFEVYISRCEFFFILNPTAAQKAPMLFTIRGHEARRI